MPPRYQITRPAQLPAIACPCGETRRAFVDDPGGVASLHIVHISSDARTHYHKRLSEIYYILDGEGEMELDGERHAVRPGVAILIKPGCRHRAIGLLLVINVAIPAFDPEDEFFDEQLAMEYGQMTKIKTGIIGTGFIGPAHVEALRRLGFVEVAAVAERGQELAQAKADQLSIPKAYGDYKQMLADPAIKVIHNCTPNHLHFAINKEILAAKKHIISEKPLAMNSQESRELVRLAKEAGVVHAINFNYRYMPLVQHAHQMCQAAGDVGRIYAVHGSYLQDWLLLENDWNWRLVPELSGDSRAVADVGSHWCDLVQFITGMKVVRVMADLVTIHPTRKRPEVEVETYAGKVLRPEDLEDVAINTEDYGSILIEFDTGAHGCLTVNQCAAGRKNRLYVEIDGSKCAIAWNQERPNELWIGRRDGPNQTIMKDPSLLYPAAREYAHYPGGHNEGYPDGPKNFFRNVYGFIAGVRPGGDFSTFVDGHNEIAICDAVLKSSREKKWVDVEY